MEPHGILLSRGGGGNNVKTGDAFIDRSKVRILLCDNDSKGSGEVFTLLCKCSYQVILVKSPRQVIDALNAEGPNIDIILSEVDLPMAKGLKMLKYIMRKELRRIPVIMMSAQDEVTLVVKCLRLGAADYLVKPLRTNELLNLWTHMWRRRRMLGLAEKKMMNYEFDLVLSDPSDANTNSTMFSDDTDEKSRKSANPETSVSIHRADEIKMILSSGPTEKQLTNEMTSGPKKSQLKIGQSSAFFTYKSKTTTLSSIQKQPTTQLSKIDNFPINNGPHSANYPYNNNNTLHGSMNLMSSSASSTYYPPQHMISFPYYPVNNLCLPPGQMALPAGHPWGSYGGSLTSDGKVQTVDRREAALLKFRQKRKDRCFDKKIRYVNRKKLAEKRPRVRGQFVRKVNGIDVDLNGKPTCTEFDDEDEEEQQKFFS